MTIQNWFKDQTQNQELIAKLKKIKLLVCDVDGTLTDGTMYYDQNGEGGRHFCIQDGYGLVQARKAGLMISLLSGKKNLTTQIRGKQLGIPDELMMGGSLDKPSRIRKLMETYNLKQDQIAMFGDDWLDAQVKLELPEVFFAAPQNLVFYLEQIPNLIIPRNGGNGALRALLTLMMYVQERHEAQDIIHQMIEKA